MSVCLLCGLRFKVSLDYKNLFFFNELSDNVLCSSCEKKFDKLDNFNKCLGCFKPMKHTQKICNDCLAWKKIYGEKLLYNISLLKYNKAFHDLMVNYKRLGDYQLKQVLANFVKEKIPPADYYVAIPTSSNHLNRRKFDTIFEIFNDIVPLTNILINTGNQSSQGKKNRKQRLATCQMFEAKSNFNLDGTVLLLDDIYTTGRTLYHARDAINQEYPNLSIKSFTISR